RNSNADVGKSPLCFALVRKPIGARPKIWDWLEGHGNRIDHPYPPTGRFEAGKAETEVRSPQRFLFGDTGADRGLAGGLTGPRHLWRNCYGDRASVLRRSVKSRKHNLRDQAASPLEAFLHIQLVVAKDYGAVQPCGRMH